MRCETLNVWDGKFAGLAVRDVGIHGDGWRMEMFIHTYTQP